MKYLSHVISSQGIDPDQSKIEAMLHKNLRIKQLRVFLGVTGYYRRFIKNYASTVFNLTELLRKDDFSWNIDSQTSFQNLN